MPDMTQELKDQRRRDFDHTLRNIAPELVPDCQRRSKIQTVVDSLRRTWQRCCQGITLNRFEL